MLLLTTSSDLLRLITDAAGDIEVHAWWIDHAAGVFTPDRANIASITSATTTTLVSGAASTDRNVRWMSIRNNHASQVVLCTVFHTDGTNQEDLFECVLAAGEVLVFTEDGEWIHYAANGSRVAALLMATQAIMEAGLSDTAVVSPGRQHNHPAHPKCWANVTVSGGTPTLQNSYNVTSITDTAQGRLTITIDTDFSSANWSGLATVERASTALANANQRMVNIENAGQAAGTILLECGTGKPNATDETLEDPTSWHFLGLGDQ